uniref:Uncharacterized protein n=1 Tax=Anguilla anguilla TaxID=7936 RepID=A0A0E9UCJ0_ANGAN
METDSSLLTSEMEQLKQEELYHQLLMQTMGEVQHTKTRLPSHPA